MDQKVLMTQVWLNNTYLGRNGYIECDEDGATGNGTIASLISALQIEIGVATPTGEFGPITAEMCPTIKLGSAGNKVNILQGALWCKGFSSSNLTGDYDGATIAGVNKFKKEAGLPQDGVVNPKTFKGILNTDAVVLISGGDSRIREIQQGLNKNYSECFWVDLNICPCDGYYERNTCNALLYAFQQAIGVDTPNGTFGMTTSTLAGDHVVSLWSGQTELVVLLQYMLYVNSFDPGEFDGGFGYGVQDAVMGFQELMALDADGIVGLSTWAALLVSKGNANRTFNAIDCTDRISLARGRYLKSRGVNYCGRYINGYWRVTTAELNNILDAGLKLFPIFQRSGYDNIDLEFGCTTANYFTNSQGRQDAIYAVKMAERLGLEIGTTIYFAVDFDVYDYEVDSNILPYFQGVNSQISFYNVGIYGARKVCTRVKDAGYSSKSFVSDMSTGFSGNIGQKIPSDWAFDQFSESSLGSDGNLTFMGIDKVIASGRDNGVSSNLVLNPKRTLCQYTIESLGFETPIDWEYSVIYNPITTPVDMKYKMGVSGSFVPIINPENVPIYNKTTFDIIDGRFDSASYSSAVELYDSLDATLKMELGDSKTLQPTISLANTINNGKINLSITVDSFGRPVFDVLVEHKVHYNTVDEESVFIEAMYTLNKNQFNQEELESIKNTALTALGAAALIIFIMALITAVASEIGAVIGSAFLALILLA